MAGQKKVRGVPQAYDQLKRQMNLSLTEQAIQGLDALAKERKLSRSELLERLGRGLLSIAEPNTLSFDDERHLLPDRPAIYIVFNDDHVRYVGRSENPKKNLAALTNPGLRKIQAEAEDYQMVWLECSDPEWLPLLKDALTVEALEALRAKALKSHGKLGFAEASGCHLNASE